MTTDKAEGRKRGEESAGKIVEHSTIDSSLKRMIILFFHINMRHEKKEKCIKELDCENIGGERETALTTGDCLHSKQRIDQQK